MSELTTIYTDQKPSFLNQNDSVETTFGTLFAVSAEGLVRGIRWFFPQTAPSSDPIAVLYSWEDDSTGQELARAEFPHPLLGTWNVAEFSEPVLISPNARYVAAVWTPDYYTVSAGQINAGIYNGLVAALPNETGAKNGRVGHSGTNEPAFPDELGNTYFVDPLFQAV